MSYDIDLVIDTGGRMPHVVEEFNITYNVSGMLDLAFDTWTGNYPGSGNPVHSISDLNKWKAEQAYVPVLLALNFLKDPKNETELRAREPINRWGALEELVDFLERFLESLKAHPLTTIAVF